MLSSIASCSRAACQPCSRRMVFYASRSRSSVIARPSFSQRPSFLPVALTATSSSPGRQFSISTRRYEHDRASQQALKQEVLGQEYLTDDYSNLPSSILSRLASRPVLPYTPSHPLTLLRNQIESHLSQSTAIRAPSPVVSTELNFGKLGFPEDHPGRSPTDTYYLNRTTCLRTHTSAHEVDVFAEGHDRWLLTADVYRRDEIDATHYPIFHQMEGACVFELDAYKPGGQVERECEEMEAHLRSAAIEIEDKVDLQEAGGWQIEHESDPAKLRAANLAMRHLKATLNGLVLELFGARHAAEASDAASTPLRVRWISAFFPFTSPSFEVEVLFRGKWLEILGCGVVKNRTLLEAKRPDRLGWAFGLGLERIAMVLYSIPDIRLFWSKDPRFLSQFSTTESDEAKTVGSKTDAAIALETGVSAAGGALHARLKPKLVTFRPYSKYPPCYKDVSFWLPLTGENKGQGAASPAFHENDLMEIVRDVASDLVEDVGLIDDFVHPKTSRRSKCYRINYRSMDR